MNNYVKTMINQMSRRTGIKLSKKHMDVLQFAYDYYRENKVGPMYHLFEKKMGIKKTALEHMFPSGLLSVYVWIGIPITTPNNLCKQIADVSVSDKREIYFDHNGTTYLRDEIKNHLINFYLNENNYGNASSSTFLGKNAYEQIFNARVEIAKNLNVSPSSIIFTSSGSESNNFAIKGIAFNYLEKKGHIISSSIEHPSVLNTLKWLENIGFEVTLIDNDKNGNLNLQQLKSSFRSNTILVALMAANNEIGNINDFREIGKICKEKSVPFFADAIQAVGKLSIKPKDDNISLMSFSGHKIYAPKGVAALYIDEHIHLSPLIHGGEQEFGLRSGTENTALITSLSKAVSLSCREMKNEQARLKNLQNYFISKLEKSFPDALINGSLENRLPNNLNVAFPDVDSGALLLSLNHIGVYVSSGSTCSSGSKDFSHVIKALKINTKKYGIIRFSFGLKNKIEDIDYLFEYLPEILLKLKTKEN